MNSISSINYMVSFLSNTLSRGLVSISARSNKITISISNEVLRPVVNFLSKSTYIKANSLLDIGLLIIQKERIDLRLIIYVIC
jgi:hypothetical protein